MSLNWKVNGVGFLGFESIAMARRQLPSQMVKGTAQIVDCIPDNQAPIIIDLNEAINADDEGVLITVELLPE